MAANQSQNGETKWGGQVLRGSLYVCGGTKWHVCSRVRRYFQQQNWKKKLSLVVGSNL